MFLLEDLFDVKDIDQDGKKFDNGPLPPPPPNPSSACEACLGPERRRGVLGDGANQLSFTDGPSALFLCGCKRGYPVRISIVPSRHGHSPVRVEEENEVGAGEMAVAVAAEAMITIEMAVLLLRTTRKGVNQRNNAAALSFSSAFLHPLLACVQWVHTDTTNIRSSSFL